MGLFSGLGEFLQNVRRGLHRGQHWMTKAAGISSVQLVCHNDTWDALIGMWNDSPRVPDDRITQRPDNTVAVTLSGPNLVTLLFITDTQRAYSPARTFVDQAIADRVFQQIVKVIDAVDPDAGELGKPIPPIVLDDRLGDTSTAL